MNNLIVDTHKFFLSPSGANIKHNNTKNSSMVFNIVNPITNNPNIVYATVRCVHAEIPYSFYIVNSNNNFLSLSTGNITIPVGNYNANTLIAQLNSQFPTNMSISFNTSTGKFTITHDSPFSISSTSTCYKLLGFDANTTYNSDSNIIIMPYPCNLMGTKNLYIKMSNFIFDNQNTGTKDKTTLTNIAVNVPCYNLIFYNNVTPFGTIIKNNAYPDKIDLEIYDDDNNLVDFNNIEWNITIEIDFYTDFSDSKN